MDKTKTNTWKQRAGILVLFIILAALILPAAACSTNGGQTPTDTAAPTKETGTEPAGSEEPSKIEAMGFTLADQNGKEHKLSDYRGKVVFLNFWATWCPPCKQELPDIEALYKEHQNNGDDLAVIGIVYPSSGSEMDVEGIRGFLDENQISFPVLMDEAGSVFRDYQVTGLPTTFMIDHEGNFIGYVQGALSRELMDYYVEDAISNMKG